MILAGIVILVLLQFKLLIEACKDGRVRLVGGDTAMEGRVEVCTMGNWKEVGYCGQIKMGASVICNQLGYLGTGKSIIIIQVNLKQ